MGLEIKEYSNTTYNTSSSYYQKDKSIGEISSDLKKVEDLFFGGIEESIDQMCAAAAKRALKIANSGEKRVVELVNEPVQSIKEEEEQKVSASGLSTSHNSSRFFGVDIKKTMLATCTAIATLVSLAVFTTGYVSK